MSKVTKLEVRREARKLREKMLIELGRGDEIASLKPIPEEIENEVHKWEKEARATVRKVRIMILRKAGREDLIRALPPKKLELAWYPDSFLNYEDYDDKTIDKDGLTERQQLEGYESILRMMWPVRDFKEYKRLRELMSSGKIKDKDLSL